MTMKQNMFYLLAIFAFVFAANSAYAVAACIERPTSIGNIKNRNEFTAQIIGPNTDVCVSGNVIRDGCFKFDNISRSRIDLKVDILGTDYRSRQYFLLYHNLNDNRPVIRELLSGSIILRFRYLGSPKGVFRVRLLRVRC